MATTPGTLRAALLGAARIEGPEGAVERLRTRTAFALLVYLLLHRSRAHARDELVERFWPDDDFEAARAKLRLALHSIRATFEDILHSDRHLVSVACPERVWTDRDEFLRLMTPVPGVDRGSRLARALALYQGPFLPGFYDDWAVEERERLETAYASALRETAAAHAESGGWIEALDAANRLVAVEPYDEAAHVLALRALRALGRGEATRKYLEWTRERFAEIGARIPPKIEAFALAPTEPSEEEPEAAFLGREADLSDVLERVGNGGIVTLWGVAGLGKTRLAREVLRGLAARGRRTESVSAVGVESVEALGAALRERLAPSAGLGEEPAQALEVAPPTVVLIDNFEGLPPEAAELLDRIRRGNPGLTFLVTSQRRLGLRDEAVVPLAPLDVPSEGASTAQVAASSSVRLLRQRVRERGRRLRVDDANAAALGALCRRLDGLPLALELAAEWLDVLAPLEIVHRLDERGRRLAARFPGRDPRHLSLEAAIEASLSRLEEPLRQAIRAFAVPVGGWDLAAAEAVLAEGDALAALAELEARSLVKVEDVGGRTRYAMLESIRLFVRAATPEAEFDVLLRRHAAHFVAIGARMEADVTSLVSEYRRDDENVRQAAETTLERETDPERAAIGIGGFQGYWQKLGRWELAKASLVRALERLPDKPNALRGRLYNWLAYAAAHTDDKALVDASLAQQIAIYEAMGDDFRLAVVRGGLGCQLADRGDYEGAIPLLQGFLDAVRGRNYGFNGGAITVALLDLGDTLLNAGQEDEGYALVEEALAIGVEAQSPTTMGFALSSLGAHLRLRRRPHEAEAHLRRAVELFEEVHEPAAFLICLAHLAAVLAERGEVNEARSTLRTVADLVAAQNRPLGYAYGTESAAWVAHAAGDDERAAWLLGASHAHQRSAPALSPLHRARFEEVADAVRAEIGPEAFAREGLRGETAERKGIVAAIRAVSESVLECEVQGARCEEGHPPSFALRASP